MLWSYFQQSQNSSAFQSRKREFSGRFVEILKIMVIQALHLHCRTPVVDCLVFRGQILRLGTPLSHIETRIWSLPLTPVISIFVRLIFLLRLICVEVFNFMDVGL